MPNDLTTVREDVILKDSPGGHDSIIQTKREQHVDHEGTPLVDPFQGYDEWAAGQVFRVLRAEYPGHDFRVIHDSHQGVCLISIPILMGINRYMAVNLKTHTMDSHRAIAAGGEILERYGLRRGRFEEASFLDARAKHSILVDRSRKVPD